MKARVQAMLKAGVPGLQGGTRRGRRYSRRLSRNLPRRSL